MKPSACEFHRNYLLLQVVCPRQGWDVKSFCKCLLQMNLYLIIMPCLKGEEGRPQAMKRTNVPFDEIEMCMIILCAVPFGLSMAYWANKVVGHFPTETRTLINDLALLDPEYEHMQKLLKQVQGQIKGSG